MRCFVDLKLVLGLVLCALICAGGSGCGSGIEVPPLFSVTGKVTYQGKPVPGATIIFSPEAPSKTGKGKDPLIEKIAGETDDDGNYVLVWGEKNDGAPPGKYKVSIAAVEPFGPDDDSEAPRKNLLPDVYASPQTSGLTWVVKEEDNVANFDLK